VDGEAVTPAPAPTPEQIALAKRVPYSVRDIAEAIAAAEERGQKKGYRAAVLTNGATPYPLLDVLRILADAADHLLKDHNCDTHGWEETHEAACAAREIIAEVVRECGAGVLGEGQGDGGAT
jgi:nucleoside-diphosphate-sugar epimerase